MNPFFSIIIPTYNRVHLISKAIDSVIAQTFENWELIIVDDGSTDNTKELIANYQEKDTRIRYIYQENAERSTARNNGSDNARGEYICFLDSDDYYLPKHLFNLNNCISDQVTIYYVGLVLERENMLIKRNELPVNGLKKFNQLCYATIHSQQVCIPAIIVKACKFNKSIRIAEDLELWVRINQQYKFHYIENSFSVVVVEHSERTIDLKNNVGMEQLATYKYIFSKNHPGNLISSDIKNTLLSSTYFTIFKFWLFKRNRINCLYYLMKSIYKRPIHEQTKYKIHVLVKLFLGFSFKKIYGIV